MHINRDLTAAFVTPLVLTLLADQERYGYDLIRRVRESSGGALQWSEGMLYPVLHRLELRGLVSSGWLTGETGRRRRCYSITPKGRAELARQLQEWQVVLSTLGRHGFRPGDGAAPIREQEPKCGPGPQPREAHLQEGNNRGLRS
jgi:DNA-binding PadR family transcriptional regulator